MTIEHRALTSVDEIGTFMRAMMHGFHQSQVSDAAIKQRERQFEPDRFWVATDAGDVVGTWRAVPLATTLPDGCAAPTAGVTSVAVAPTHRRRGIMAEMMRRGLAAARERGDALASLIAAEWPIYGRYGFGPAVEHVDYTLDASATFTYGGAGSIERVDTATLRRLAPEVYERHRLACVGEITRLDPWWDPTTHVLELEPWTGFQVVCRADGGEVTGYAMYTVEEKWEGRRAAAVCKVDELVATDPASEARLWRYLCEIDWVSTVVAEVRRVHEPLSHWIADGRHLRTTLRSDLIWARPLDVAACLVARTYARPGSLVIEVRDPMGFDGGCFRLETADDGTASCTAARADPDLTMPVSALGTIVYGGTAISELARAGLVDEHRAGALRWVDTAFRSPVAPWTTTWF